MATANEQLAAAIEAAAEATAKVEELKKQSRDADLVNVKALIKSHGFTVKDLKPELVVSRTKRRTTTARKTTPRKPRKPKAA